MLTNTNSGDIVSEKVELLIQDHFLFIGNPAFYYNTLKPAFGSSSFVTTLADAKTFISQSGSLPDMIIINTELNHFELVEFKVWTRSNNVHNIPLIYNQAMLAPSQTKQLFSQKLVEDVIDLEMNFGKLPHKLRFLRKIGAQRFSNKPFTMVRSGVQPNKLSPATRLLDIVMSSIAIIIALPLFIIIAIVIKLESKGPIFYCAQRAGKGFRVFTFYKFRTMIVNADKQIKQLEGLNQYKVEEKKPLFVKFQNDPRVTKVGAFLRKTSLDELPQFFNVLKGDMSIVGNRPLPLYEASTLTTDAWAERFMAPAGITGLWQVSKRGHEEMDHDERILLDIDYARTRSLLGDLRILLRTPAALIQKTNV